MGAAIGTHPRRPELVVQLQVQGMFLPQTPFHAPNPGTGVGSSTGGPRDVGATEDGREHMHWIGYILIIVPALIGAILGYLAGGILGLVLGVLGADDMLDGESG